MAGDFVKICRDDEIADGEIRQARVGDSSILLARYDGRLYALDDFCSHDGAALGDGDIVDGQIQCPRHGARFDLKTGAATQMPAVVGIETFDVKIDNGDIYVAIEE